MRPFAILVLAILGPAALAQIAERPVVHPGDRWQFVQYYSVPSSEPNRRWVITRVGQDRIEGTEDGEPLVLTPELGVLDSPRGTYSGSRSLAFPLEAGKKWRYAHDWHFKATGSRGRAEVDVEVVAYEKVSVPAGTFEAFRLVSKAHTTGKSPKGSLIDGVVTTTYWYAPAARAIVRSVTHNPYVGTSTVELVSAGR
jgi:hypothetical protein